MFFCDCVVKESFREAGEALTVQSQLTVPLFSSRSDCLFPPSISNHRPRLIELLCDPISPFAIPCFYTHMHFFPSLHFIFPQLSQNHKVFLTVDHLPLKKKKPPDSCFPSIAPSASLPWLPLSWPLSNLVSPYTAPSLFFLTPKYERRSQWYPESKNLQCEVLSLSGLEIHHPS